MADTTFNYAKFYGRAHLRRLKWWSGGLNIDNVDHIRQLVSKTSARRLLDYGSGKGYQYLKDRVHDAWGGILPHCYDIGVHQLKNKPKGKFDGVICTDVMEHIHRDDIDIILSDIFGLLEDKAFAYFNIFCNEAAKTFPDGTNVHLTVKSPEWWDKRLRGYARDGLTIWADYEYRNDVFETEL